MATAVGSEERQRSAFWTVVEMANPAFVAAAVGVPILALVYALAVHDIATLNYVHVMAGVLWTGIDLFMGIVLGPVIGGLSPPERVALFKRLTPKMTFLMPTLATVAITGGWYLSHWTGIFDLANPWVWAAGIIALILTVQGFGVLLPNEVRIFRQILSDDPDVELVGKLGMRNAMLGGVQGVFQLLLIFVMANLRYPAWIHLPF